ncbi:MAG: tRNA (adenosine(37)-N6)-dimethylallyltransferase MiaA [Peptococcaceae bacterium]|nr:tRNA (adenosine(37)-N6)-dimethylallyltransferase MiaA [Peptococcaceae bacterium]
MKERLLVILGPTASGKTALSVEIAARIGGEVISGDSMQFYQGMDIGTAKITPEEQVAENGYRVPHHLINNLTPDMAYSVADFQKDAGSIIEEITARNHIPMLVGGTGLYINAVTDGDKYQFPVEEISEDFRREKEREAILFGREYLHQQLAALNPERAREIHANNIKRVIRALEIETAKKQQALLPEKKEETGKFTPSSAYDLILIGLSMPRELLYARINKRVDIMMEQGLLDEVKGLLASGYDKELNAMQGIGYRQLVAYLEGLMTLEEAISLIKRDTRRFAKRQMTWFRKDARIQWFDVSAYPNQAHLTEAVWQYIAAQWRMTPAD